jgi:hypothetical protein
LKTQTTEEIEFVIVRRTSPYNKYIKWFREYYANRVLISSIGYKTESAARDFPRESTMPIGDKIITYHYTEGKPEYAKPA